ncbi:Crp/Fnr family transcriptional regulator [Actinomadura flavalba]|uniref:Crp/Fnr family transcriptional regulator n=1 Tax=Actinomadura flavalba TaxID=1120938 RepID=UPI000365F849|nr:Crp/Fnr family transcriptional regulator [Actinomadura flavalba]
MIERPSPADHRPLPFWSALEPSQRTALRDAGLTRRYPARGTLCHQGDASDHVVVIESGWAKASVTGPEGHAVVLAVRGPGDLVCESAVLGDRQRSATVTALSPLRGLIVQAVRFTAFLEANPAVWKLVSGTFVGRLDDAGRRAQAHVSARGAQRLAQLLVELAEQSLPHVAPAADGGLEIAPPLSQEELGSCMDSSRETVARAFGELRERGLARTGWRQTVITDLPGLREFARHGV